MLSTGKRGVVIRCWVGAVVGRTALTWMARPGSREAGEVMKASRGPFRHILVPTDLTKRTWPAIDLAVQLAKPRPARLTLLHVIETIPGADPAEFESFYRELEKKAQTRLRSLADRCAKKGRKPSMQAVVYGRRADEIVRFAKNNNVDLVVLVSHKVDATDTGPIPGTISYKVGVLAPCPVLLIK